MITKLGKYELLEHLGSGATADVYHAVDTLLGREVALKILKPSLVADADSFKRFVYEAQSAARLFHNHIATVLDMGEDAGQYFIALRYVNGKSLDTILREQGPLLPKEAFKLADQIGEALDYAHKQGFLHRDVKPSNMLRDQNGDFWLTDFGLTKAMMSTGMSSHTGAVLGTPPYIAPEVWLGEQAVPATDQYALACVVYEALTGKVLFAGETPPAVMTNHVLKGAQLVSNDPKYLPAEIIDVLKKALAKSPGDRFASNAAFANALHRTPAESSAEPQADPDGI